MKNGFVATNFNDDNDNPAGGTVVGLGFTIVWQNGPLGRGAERMRPNGAFVEDIIDAVISRIKYYQDSKFACEENADALIALEQAAIRLSDRTVNREVRNVEGTHER